MAAGKIVASDTIFEKTEAAGMVNILFDDRIYIAAETFRYYPSVFNKVLADESIHQAQFHSSLASKLGWMSIRPLYFYYNVLAGDDAHDGDPAEIWADVFSKWLSSECTQ